MAQAMFTEMMKHMGNFSMPSFNMDAMVAAGRRNMETMSAAAQVVSESAQTIARRQMEAARTSMEQALHTSREMMTGGNPETNIAKQAAFAQEAMETAMQNLREVSDMATKSSFEAAQMLQKRFAASMTEMQQVASKK